MVLIPTTSLELTSLNGGESFTSGSTKNITWTSSGVSTAKLEYSTDGGSTWYTVADSTSASAGSYTWKVPAISSERCKVRISSVDDPTVYDESDGVFSIVASVNPPSTVSSANMSDNGLTLSWTDASDDELGFIIEQKAGAAVFSEIARTNPNVTSFTVTNLKPETQYSFRIRSYTIEGYSAPTDAITITTLAAVLTLSPYKSIDLNVGDFVEFNASGGSGSYTWISSNTDVATIDATGILTARAAGAMAVIVKDSGGNATTSALIRVTTGMPKAPTSLAAEPLASSAVRLSWTDTADDESSFRIEYKEQGGSYEELFMLGPNMTTFTAGGLQSETTYTFRVLASNGFGDSQPSNEISVTTPAALIKVSPDSSLYLSPISIDPDGWVLFEASGGETPYTWVTTNENGSIDEGGIFSAQADGPVMVKVQDNEGNFEYSKVILIDSEVPYPPGDLKARAVSTSAIELTWEDNSENEEGFVLESKTGGGEFTELYSVRKNTATHLETSLKEGSTYTFRMKSYNRNGSSKYSNQISARTGSTVTVKRQVAGGSYNLFAVPCYPENGDPLVVLDELGAYDTTKWRLGHWSGSAYQECPSIDAFAPGKGFWFIAKDALEIAVTGRSTDPTGVFEIELKPGWNQIGNPFELPVDWSFSQVEKDGLVYSIASEKATGVENRLVGYSGGGYGNKTQMESWQGYWVRNNGSNSVMLRLSVMKQSAMPVAKAAIDDDLVWSMNISVSDGKYADTDNVIGVRKSATDSWDAYDWHEPPLPLEGVSLYFVKDRTGDDRRSCDFRPKSKEWMWRFAVESTSPGESCVLGFGMSDDVLERYSITVFEVASGIEYPVSNVSSIPVKLDGTSRSFELFVTERDGSNRDGQEVSPESFTVGNPFPNPFNAGTTISYSLPVAGDVRISVYNVLGQVVFDQSLMSQSPGNRTFTWNGKDSAMNPVNSGVYLIKVESGKYSMIRKALYVK